MEMFLIFIENKRPVGIGPEPDDPTVLAPYPGPNATFVVKQLVQHSLLIDSVLLGGLKPLRKLGNVDNVENFGNFGAF